MYKIIIIEDELLLAESLKTMIEELGHEVILIVDNLDEAKEVINAKKECDLFIVDINLDGNNEGIELGHILHSKNIPFIYLTSYYDKETLSLAKTTEPESYLIKPATKQEIFTNIEIVMAKDKSKTSTNNHKLKLKDGSKTHLINQNDINFIKADRIYLEIHLEDKMILQRTNFKEILAKLEAVKFCRVHRSWVINLNSVESVASNHVVINNQKIPISLSYKNEFKQKFEKT